MPRRVRVLRAALLVMWIGFLLGWLIAIEGGVQPTVLLVATTFLGWLGVWGAGHLMLRRERCPVCGGLLFVGEVFETLRATQCASCDGTFAGRKSSAPVREPPDAPGTDALPAEPSDTPRLGPSDTRRPEASDAPSSPTTAQLEAALPPANTEADDARGVAGPDS